VIAALHSYATPDGRSYLGAVVKRAYAMSRAGVLSPLTEAPPFYREPVYREVNGGRELLHDCDLMALAKPSTDVLLRGSAYTRPASRRVVDTGVRVGAACKVVRVWGDRRIEVGAGGGLPVGFGAPEPFESMPLSWERAYGGPDLAAETELFGPAKRSLARSADLDGEGLHGALTYPRNSVGRGFFVGARPERMHRALAPNLEDPADPVEPGRVAVADVLEWIDCPVAASYGPIDPLTFPRAAFLLQPEIGTPLRPVREVAVGALRPEDLFDRDFLAPPDPRLFNCAPAGLAAARLSGGERVDLWNLPRDRELFEVGLPRERPSIVIERPGCGTWKLESQLATLFLEPDDERATLTWAATLEVAAPFPEAMMQSLRHAVLWSH